MELPAILTTDHVCMLFHVSIKITKKCCIIFVVQEVILQKTKSSFGFLKEKLLYYKNNTTKFRGKNVNFFDIFGVSAIGSIWINALQRHYE